ncbi:MAG: hypothetical protein ACXVCS_22385 [Bdellovibrionota bacterium]
MKIFRNPALPWVLLFMILSFVNVQIGGTNAVSRIAGLRAITEGGTPNIDRYYTWSDDWAISPNHHYYPNKAPGGVLLGLPAFALVDFPIRWLDHTPLDALGRAPPPGLLELSLFCFLTQVLPFALLVFFLSSEFRGNPAPVHFFALAALFGNTAALYMNTYFGHGLAALLMLGCFAAWLRARYACSGALIAACLLTEYGTAFVLPFFLLATLWRERSWRPMGAIVLGSLPFAALWIWYHQVAFGSPLALAIKFSNPDMITDISNADGTGIWGMISFLPSPLALQKLLFGPERGLLFTQPWVLAVFPFMFLRTSLPRGTKTFLCGGLCGLLWMNASIGGWDGGFALGPRYLSQILPAIGLAFALSWKEFSNPWKMLLTIGLVISVAFRILVYPFPVLAAPVNLWALHIYLYSLLPWSAVPYLHLALAITGFAVCGAWAWRKRLAPVNEA